MKKDMPHLPPDMASPAAVLRLECDSIRRKYASSTRPLDASSRKKSSLIMNMSRIRRLATWLNLCVNQPFAEDAFGQLVKLRLFPSPEDVVVAFAVAFCCAQRSGTAFFF